MAITDKPNENSADLKGNEGEAENPLANLFQEFVSVTDELGEFSLTREDYSPSAQQAKTQRLLKFEEALTLEGQIEAILFASPKPLRAAEILELIQTDDNAYAEENIAEVIDTLVKFYEERGSGFRLESVKGAYQFRTVPAAAVLMERLFATRPRPLSRAALESLAIIAYRQPVTRAEVEYIRGVDAGSIIKNLIERNLITCVGRKEDAGRPMLFGTTQEFLDVFRLNALSDLPPLAAFQPAPETVSEARQKLENGEEEVDVEGFIGDESDESLSDEQRAFLGEENDEEAAFAADDDEGIREEAASEGEELEGASYRPGGDAEDFFGNDDDDDEDDDNDDDEDDDDLEEKDEDDDFTMDDEDEDDFDEGEVLPEDIIDHDADEDDDDDDADDDERYVASEDDYSDIDKSDPFWELSLLEKKSGPAAPLERQGATGKEDNEIENDEGTDADSEMDLTTGPGLKKRGRKTDRGETDLD